MARAPVQETMPGRTLGAFALPWLLSSTLHLVAFVLLALSWQWSSRQAPAAAGIALEASLLSSSGREPAAAAFRLDAPPAEGYFDDDEPAMFADSSDEARESGAAALSTLLNEEPAVSLAGVLPASGLELGSGGLDSLVGSAAELTSEPPPPDRLRGGYARTGIFGIEGEGHKFVYVFDRSGSMDGYGGAPMAAAKAELLNSLNDLGQTHQFQIIFYNHEPRVFTPSGGPGRLTFGTEQNKNLARRFVGSITASGATRHVEPLLMALRMSPDVIFFLTDADEPRLTPSELAHIAQRNRGTTINAIEFGTRRRPDNDNFLVALARQNGGQYVFVDVSQLNPANK